MQFILNFREGGLVFFSERFDLRYQFFYDCLGDRMNACQEGFNPFLIKQVINLIITQVLDHILRPGLQLCRQRFELRFQLFFFRHQCTDCYDFCLKRVFWNLLPFLPVSKQSFCFLGNPSSHKCILGVIHSIRVLLFLGQGVQKLFIS
ncbi:hypothetical protein SDC9_192950 [bioreactor metagenome]|uniref:Uncharacterized protein n=1 Tax=bioreactor metagenome TaxID=1076179 RepID=A0A645ID80_9ZZZZ